MKKDYVRLNQPQAKISFKRRFSSVVNFIALMVIIPLNIYFLYKIAGIAFDLGLSIIPETPETIEYLRNMVSYAVYCNVGYIALYLATPDCKFKRKLKELI